MTKTLILSCLMAIAHLVGAQSFATIDSIALFQSGKDGYDTYRIPSIILTKSGSLLAICEARKDGRGDAGNIDIVMKRSENNGKTWSNQTVLWDDGENTCGNPCPVVDMETGEIHLVLTHNLGKDHETDIIWKRGEATRTVWVMSSKDHGKTWSAPRNITETTKNKDWGWYATGPGIGIQIEHGPNKGRLVIPSDHSYTDQEGKVRNGPFEYGSHVIYSDDHGQTWKMGGIIKPKMNECQIVEVGDGNGTLLMNLRSYMGENKRAQAISYDGGLSFTKPYSVEELVEPVCQGSIIRYSWPTADKAGLMLFLNPASSGFRRNLSLRKSFDDGKTWPEIQTIFPGHSAYSSLVKMKNGDLGLFYEAGPNHPYENLIFHSVKMKN